MYVLRTLVHLTILGIFLSPLFQKKTTTSLLDWKRGSPVPGNGHQEPDRPVKTGMATALVDTQMLGELYNK